MSDLLCLRSDRALSPRREIEQQTPHWSQINPLAPAASLLFPPVKHSYNTKDFLLSVLAFYCCASSHRRPNGRYRSCSHNSWVEASLSWRHNSGQRFYATLLSLWLAHEDNCCCPIIDTWGSKIIITSPSGVNRTQKDGDKPEALPAVTVPLLSLMKQGRSLDMLPMLLPCRGNSSTFTSTRPEHERFFLAHWRKIWLTLSCSILALSGRHPDWNDLFVKMTSFLRRLCSVLRLDGKQILLLSTDPPLLCYILSWRRTFSWLSDPG